MAAAPKPAAGGKGSVIGKPGASTASAVSKPIGKPTAKPAAPSADEISVPPPPVVTKPVPKPAIGKGPKPGAANFVPPVPSGVLAAQPDAEQPKPPAVRPLPKATVKPPAVKPAPSTPAASSTPPVVAQLSPRGASPATQSPRTPVAAPVPPSPSVPPSASSSQEAPSGDYIPVIFDDESSCIVIGESEYYYPSKEAIATVGQLCAFLEAQEDFAGKVIHPLSSRARKIGSREAKSSTVSFIKLDERDAASPTTPPAVVTRSPSLPTVAAAKPASTMAAPVLNSNPTPPAAPSPGTSVAAAARAAAASLAKKPAATTAPVAAVAQPTPPKPAAPLSSVEKAKLAALERFKADQKKKEEEEEELRRQQGGGEEAPSPGPASPTSRPGMKLSNKELLADLEDENEPDEEEINFGKFGKTIAPKGRRLPTTRYRKHLEDLKKRSKRMEYRQKFFVMEKEKKQEELQKRLDEIDEENLRMERERRKKQEEEYDNLYGAELERKKRAQEGPQDVSSMLDELDSLTDDTPREPLDPDAALFALTPGFSERREEDEFAIKPGMFGGGGGSGGGGDDGGGAGGGQEEEKPQPRRAPKQRLTLMLKDMLNSDGEPTSADAIVDFSALARAPKKQDPEEAERLRRAEEAKERKMEEIRAKKEELRRREEELNAQLAAKQAKRPGSANPADLMSSSAASADGDEPGYKTIMVQGRPRKVPVSASSASLVGSTTAPTKPLPSAPAAEKAAPEIPELHIDPDMPRPAAKGSGRGLIVPSKTSVVREVDLPGGRSLQIRHGDLTKEDVEIIVNAANDLLQHGSGVSGTIVRNGGRKIKKESDEWIAAHGRVPPGQIAVTSGGNLTCKYIVHAVGPAWTEGGGTPAEVSEFMSALRLTLAACNERKATSVAFPALSIANGFPKNLAAALTFQAVLEHWKNEPTSTVKHVRLTNYDLETVAVFKDEFERRAKESFAVQPLPANYKDLLATLPTVKESSEGILGDEDVSDMLEQIALSRAASGKQEKK